MLLGSIARPEILQRAVGAFAFGAFPYLPGSLVPLRVENIPQPYSVTGFGPIALRGGVAEVLAARAGAQATLIAGNATGEAMRSFSVGAIPNGDVIAVASYEDGIVFHDPATMRARSVLGIAGAAAGVAISRDGVVATGDTAGDGVTFASREPWTVRFVPGVPLIDEIAFAPDGSLYATSRGSSEGGTVSRIRQNSTLARTAVGNTPEGIAVSPDGSRLYIANVNDGTISVVDTATMTQRSRTKIVDRPFSLALSARGDRLYVVSNQSITSPFAHAGRIVEVAVRGDVLRVLRSSDPLTFPLGVALDERGHRAFVTDESVSLVYVFDDRTLRQVRPPLTTCRTPWEPHVDAAAHRLYVPCARADAIDVYDVRTLARMPGAPFTTGGYPLAVATWHGPSERVRY